MQGGLLSLYQLVPTELRPVVGLSLVIREDFTWSVSHRDILVPVQHCTILQDIPSMLDSGMQCCAIWL